MSVRQLTQLLKEKIGSAVQALKIPKITYVVPDIILNKQPNIAVQNLLQQCKNLKALDSKVQGEVDHAKKNLINPFGNSGMNSEFV